MRRISPVSLKKIYYVYEHWRPDSDICFYVGKGKGRRAFEFKGRNEAYECIAKALADLGMCPEVRMYASGLNEEQAFLIERERIQLWKSLGVELVNKTGGGSGFSGYIRPKGIRQSEEAKRKLSIARTGMKFTEEHKQKLAVKKLGVKRKPFTTETLERMRLAGLRREEAKRAKFGDKVTRRSRLKESV